MATPAPAPATLGVESAPPSAVQAVAPAPQDATQSQYVASVRCNRNYTPCVPDDPVDVDCAGGSGNGP